VFFCLVVKRWTRNNISTWSFLFDLRKILTEALELFQEVYGDKTMSRARVFEWHKRFQERREDIEVDSKSGRPSTSRTSENIQPVTEKVCSDRRLNVLLITEEYRIWIVKACGRSSWKICDWVMDAPSRQCSCSQLLEHPGIFGQKLHCHAGATTLLIEFRLCDFFLFPKFKGSIERNPFSRLDKH